MSLLTLLAAATLAASPTAPATPAPLPGVTRAGEIAPPVLRKPPVAGTPRAAKGGAAQPVMCDRIGGAAIAVLGGVPVGMPPGAESPQLLSELLATVVSGESFQVQLTADCVPRTPQTIALYVRPLSNLGPDREMRERRAPSNGTPIDGTTRQAAFAAAFAGVPASVTLPANHRSVTFTVAAGRTLLTTDGRIETPGLAVMPLPGSHAGERITHVRVRAHPDCRESYAVTTSTAGPVRAGGTVDVLVRARCYLSASPKPLAPAAGPYGGTRRVRLIGNPAMALPTGDAVLSIDDSAYSVGAQLVAAAVTAPTSVQLTAQPLDSSAPASAPLTVAVVP